MVAEDVVMRQPLWVRLYALVFGTVWCGMVAGGLVAGALRRSPAVVVPVLMLAFGGTLIYRVYRMGVRTDDGVMVVRNQWRTRVLQRAEIEGFRIGDSAVGIPGVKVVYALLAEGDLLSLDITASMVPLVGSRRRLDERLERLRTWHAGTKGSDGNRRAGRSARGVPLRHRTGASPRPSSGVRTRRVPGLWRS